MSADNRPMEISMEIRKDIGIVNIKSEGKRKKMSFKIEIKLIPLLTYKSIICRILPIIRTKVNTNKIMKNKKDVSLNMYRLIILFILIFISNKYHLIKGYFKLNIYIMYDHSYSLEIMN